jgi:hypothetical protein
MKEVFSGYLKKKKTWKFWKPVEYEVNEAWFDGHFKNIGICSTCKTEKEFEEVWRDNALSIWPRVEYYDLKKHKWTPISQDSFDKMVSENKILPNGRPTSYVED